jgi:SAM-dependent methyltransferase
MIDTRRATVFDAVADAYDRHRPAYPDALVDLACELAGIGPGDPVLEVGCGTGQLTRGLAARGLRVTALEPGAGLLARARAHVSAPRDPSRPDDPSRARDQNRPGDEVEFVHGRFEDAVLPRGRFRAAFAASSVHWVEPSRSWRGVAHALAPGGTLALLSYFGLADELGGDDGPALRATVAAVAPQAAAEWPEYRTLDDTLAGARQRSANVSATWAWLSGHDLARDEAADLFGSVEVFAVPTMFAHTARELSALLGTMSFWSRLAPDQQARLDAVSRALQARLGRPIRSSSVALLVTARRRVPSAPERAPP